MGRCVALVLALQWALQPALALRRTPWLRSGADTPESRSSGSFDVRVGSESKPVVLPWLRTAWISSEQDRLNFKYAALRSRDPRYTNDFKIHNAGGMFAGIQFFNEALTKDLDKDLAKDLANCGALETMGGRRPDDFWSRGDIPDGRVWIFVNGETSMGHEFWEEVQSFILPHDRAVIIGNWWNETQEEFDSPQVVSLWVPFASTSFAERKYRTPMDLFNRSRRTKFGDRKYLVGYQQQGCNDERERFWDELNKVTMKEFNQTKGVSIGNCNGKEELGRRVELPAGYLDGPYPGSGHMDASVGRYENFKFVFASEHGQNYHGYTTEKIVNAFLAGAVPIHMGATRKQLHHVFVPGSFIWATMRDQDMLQKSFKEFVDAARNKTPYRQMLHADRPVVTKVAMKRFFSWHPDVWPEFGDSLRQKILRKALRLCREPLKPKA